MATKIYIAGKITGDPDYKAKFNAAAEAYKKKGYTVLNPSWMPQGMQKADYMRICFAMIDTADVVAFLPGYRLSAGAQLELQYCFYIDKDVKLPDDEAEGPALQSSVVQNALKNAVSTNALVLNDPAAEIKKALEKHFNQQFGFSLYGGAE